MPQAHEFGEGLIPVCTGRLHVGGRDLLYGEHAPEAATWPRHILQMHLASHNVTFVTKSQAEAMSVKVRDSKAVAQMKRLEAQAAKTKAVVTAVKASVQALEEKLADARAQLAVAMKADEDTRELLSGGEKDPEKLEAKANEIAETLPADPDKVDAIVETSVAKLEAERKAIEEALVAETKVAKEAEKANPPATAINMHLSELGDGKQSVPLKVAPVVDVKISEPQAQQIETHFKSLDHKQLKEAAKHFGIKAFGISAKALVEKVIEEAREKLLQDMRAEALAKEVDDGAAAVEGVKSAE